MTEPVPNPAAPSDTTHAGTNGQKAAAPEPPDAMDEMRERIRQLPPEVGAVLMTVGVLGLILPGPVGTPILLAGGLVLMPKTFNRVERWFAKRCPKMHEHGMRHVNRFINDFEKRYPKQPRT